MRRFWPWCCLFLNPGILWRELSLFINLCVHQSSVVQRVSKRLINPSFFLAGKMRIDYSHTLGSEEAYRRISKLLSDLQEQYTDKIRSHQLIWNSEHTRMNYSVKILGFGSKGQIILTDGQLRLEGSLPLVARLIRGKIEEKIRSRLDDILS